MYIDSAEENRFVARKLMEISHHRKLIVSLNPGCGLEGITKASLFKYIENFTTKTENFQIKNSDVFIFLLKT